MEAERIEKLETDIKILAKTIIVQAESYDRLLNLVVELEYKLQDVDYILDKVKQHIYGT